MAGPLKKENTPKPCRVERFDSEKKEYLKGTFKHGVNPTASHSVLGAASLPTRRKCKEILKSAQEMKKSVTKLKPGLLHAPEGVKDDCLLSALECFQNQSSQLKPKAPVENFDLIKFHLTKKAKQSPQSKVRLWGQSRQSHWHSLQFAGEKNLNILLSVFKT
ncbi:interleukin-21-like [Rhinatrema bivittatum]|uniref:interleukin-21-like n=1 Tax=Rhinatrema bivittatum TaxID=194408 RepID=UPI00112D969C|nr:interleukin-21-like [Rhinatrema bivittatum]